MIACPKCGREVPAAEVNIQQALARCLPCNTVFACGQGGGYSKPQVQMPKGFVAQQEGPDFFLTRRWFSPLTAFFLLFFTAFWDLFLVFWYAVALTKGAPTAAKLFPLLHVAVGVGMTYLTICTFVNSTVIKVGTQDLSVHHGPLPWPGNIALEKRMIQQLFCEEVVTRGKHGPRYSYTVWALMRDNERKKLVSGLESTDQALFIEQRLERQLSLSDRHVPGEMRS